MAHNTRVRLTWNNLTVLLPSELTALDFGVFKSVNGDDGGTWNPSTPIYFGGQGVHVTGPFIGDAATLNTPTLNTPKISAPATYVTPITKTVAIPCRAVPAVYDGVAVQDPTWLTATQISNPDVTPAYIPLQSFPGFRTQYVQTGSTTEYSAGYVIDINEYLIDGATLNSAVLTANIASAHTGVPSVLPAFGIFRFAVDTAGASGSDMSTAFGTVRTLPSNNRLLSTFSAPCTLAPTSAAQWKGDFEICRFVPDQNQVIDKTNFTYMAVIWDEGGTNAVAGNAYLHILAGLTIPGQRT